MKQQLLLILIASSLLASCHTFVGKSGRKTVQMFPSKGWTSRKFDTARFVKKPFDVSDYFNKTGSQNGKKVIETIEGNNLCELAKSDGRYLVFFWFKCPAMRSNIRRLEQIAGNDSILLVSLTSDYDFIDATLKNSRFANYPYYTIEAKRYTRIWMERKIGFIRDACGKCYEEYKDDVQNADYLVIDHGSIHMVMWNDSTNILRKASTQK